MIVAELATTELPDLRLAKPLSTPANTYRAGDIVTQAGTTYVVADSRPMWSKNPAASALVAGDGVWMVVAAEGRCWRNRLNRSNRSIGSIGATGLRTPMRLAAVGATRRFSAGAGGAWTSGVATTWFMTLMLD